MVTDLLSDLVDPKLKSDLSELRRDVNETVDTIIAGSKKTQGAFSGISMSKDLAEMLKAVNSVADAQKKTSEQVNKLADSYKKQMEAAKLATEASKEAINVEKALTEVAKQDTEAQKAKTEATKQGTEASKQATEASKQQSAAKITEAKVATEASRQKQIETNYTIALTKEKERLEKLLEKEVATLSKQQSAYYQLDKEHKAAAASAKNLGAEYVLLEREILELSNIKAPSEQITLAQKKMELQALSPVLNTANANALNLHNSLLKIDQAVGQSQRNVGNYNGAVMAMSQILREAPSFAYSLSTGILALSNNIPILVDEITKLKAVNAELTAGGGKAIPIWKTLLQAFTSPVGIITLLTSAITIFAGRMAMSSDKVDAAGESLKKYNDSMREAEKNLLGGAGSEIARLTTLTEVAKDLTSSMGQRLKAVKELQDKYPDYFANLTKEKILNGEVADAISRTTSEILANARAKAYQQKIEATTQRVIELADALKELEKANPLGKNVGNDMIISGGTTPDMGQEQKAGALKVFNEKKAVIQKQIDELMNKNKEYATEVTKLAKNAGSLFLGPSEKDKAVGNQVIKDLDALFQARKRYEEALFNEKKKEFELSAANNRAIYEDDSKTLQQRLDAHTLYQQDMAILAQVESAKEVAIIDDKLKILKEKEVAHHTGIAKLTKEQLEIISLDEKTAGIERAAKVQELQVKLAQIEANGVNTRESIIKAGQARYLNAEQKGLQDRLAEYEDSYIVDAKVLADSYLNHEISEVKFQEELRKLKNFYTGITLREQIEEDEKLLKGDQISAEQRLAIQKRLNKEKLDLSNNAVEGAGLQKKNNPFGLSNSDYDDAVKVANAGMDLYQEITKAMNSRYQTEIDMIQKKRDAQAEAAQSEIDAINKSSLSETEKEKRIQSIKEQSSLKDKQMMKEQNELKRQQAINDKAANIAAIIQKMALAIATAFTAGPLIGQIIAGITATILGVQLAQAIATPIPQYAEGAGVNGRPSHPGGLAIYGEAGPEMVIEPGKAPRIVDTATLGILAAGTDVIPLKDRVKDMQRIIGSDMSVDARGVLHGFGNAQYDNSELIAQLHTTNNELRRLRADINNKPVPMLMARNGDLRLVDIRRNGQTRYLSKRFS